MRIFILALMWLTLTALVAMGAYQYGAMHNGAVSAPMYVWPHPWFPFPVVFLLVVALFFSLRFGRRGRWGRCRDGGVPPMFDEWHRRAHAQDNKGSSGNAAS